MKPISFICVLILFATPALAQYDTNAYRNEIHKEIKSLEETLLLVKKKSLELEKESLRKDTLIEALQRKRVEVTTNLSSQSRHIEICSIPAKNWAG